MHHKPSCPDAARLRRHLSDAGLPDEGALLRHLDTCAPCQQTLQSLVLESDRLLKTAARYGAAGRIITEVPASLTLARVLETLSHRDPGKTTTVNVAAWRTFLAPPRNPGELGRIDHYAITSILGSGGMGIVFKAIDESLRRVVAIKLPSPAVVFDAEARERFTREAQAAAALVHPNVVTVHAVAETQGLPYLVTEFVPGESLHAHLHRIGIVPVAEVVQIGSQILRGLAAAHALGVVHRDIKPGNILLQDNGNTKIADFGLARLLNDPRISRSGVVAGTPDYMAPEQARGAEVDHRADLFSLGSVLYTMCTGKAPFAAEGALATLKRVCEETPAPIRELNPLVPPWLAAIIMKLHAKDPAERFQSAADVAVLLEQHLAPSPQPRSRHAWSARRWLAVLATAAALLVALAAAQIIIRIRHGDDTVTEIKVAGAARVEVEQDGKIVAAIPPAGRVLHGHSGPVRCVAFTPSGSQLVSASEDGSVRLWDVATGHELLQFHGHQVAAYAVAVSPSGRQVLSGGGLRIAGRDDPKAWSLCLWDSESGKELQRADGPEAAITSVAWSADGKRALIASYDGYIWLWDVDNWTALKRWQEQPGLWSIVLSPDGRQVLSAGGGLDGSASLRLRDAGSGAELRVLAGHRGGVWQAVFSADGRQAISVGGGDYTIRFWDLADGKELDRRSYANSMVSVALAANGVHAVSGGYDKLVRLWHVPTLKHIASFEGHTSGIQSVAYARDGRHAASGSFDKTVRLWRLPPSTVSPSSR